MKLPYIQTNDAITVVLKGRPYTVASDQKIHDEVVRLVTSYAFTEEQILDVIERNAKRLRDAARLSPNIEYSGGIVLFKGEALHNYASERLVQMLEASQDIKPLTNFVERLMRNPSKRVVDHLYAFLEHGNVPLTDDGCFLVYKAVRDNYKDIHSGKFDNSVGRVVSMPRNGVDEDPNRTCSSGLHVCSFEYLPHFSHANGHVMICKVDPAHVVAIPADYNNTKMRVSEYEVVGEVEDYYTDKRDILGEAGTQSGVMRQRYRVAWSTDDDFSEEGQEKTFFTLAEARAEAQRVYYLLLNRGEEEVTAEVWDDQEDEIVFSIG